MTGPKYGFAQQAALPPAIARMQWASAKVAHCRYPAWEASEICSVSEPGSIGVALTAQKAATVQHADRARTELRDVAANSVGLCGPEPIRWIRTSAPSEVVEITAARELRCEIAGSMGVVRHADLDDFPCWTDELVLAIALRFRAVARGWSVLSDVARDESVRCLYAHVYRRQFGGRLPNGGTKALSAAQVSHIAEFVRANLDRALDIATLAQVVALSPFHFARAFRAATGLPPHRFVTLLRLHHAESLLRERAVSVENAAALIGYSNVNHFRRLLRAQTGCLPSALRHGD